MELLVLLTLLSLVSGGAIPSGSRGGCFLNSTSPSQRGRKFLLVGHAGGDPINYCENTIAATRSAIASGANAIEIDLSISEDGVIFLWHDPNPWNILSLIRRLGLLLGDKHCYPRMENNKQSNTLSFYTISSSWFHVVSGNPSKVIKIVTLDEWLSIFGNNPVLDLIWFDFKDSEGSVDKFIASLRVLLKKHGINHNKIMFSTSSQSKGRSLQAALRGNGLPSERITVDTVSWLPFVPSWSNYDGVSKGLAMCGCCANLGSPPFAINADSALQNIVRDNVRTRELMFRSRKGPYIDVFVWTIDSPEQMKALLRLGVNGIITNRPGRLRNVINEIKMD
eukprot:TRINITY_DN5210_c0_g1_i1.p1 TRINITY_DN5210_c0_g1~~TRINITY_DN5210_c0_g1_i1.p1  ORF type:complete len:337 (+),score=83.92 TRINITY_DN5210_c0_g1_i1:219-1229(+)